MFSKNVEQISSEFDNLIKNLNSIVEFNDSSRHSATVAKVTPYFQALSSVWNNFRKADDQLKDIEKLLSRLRRHRDTFIPSLGEVSEGISQVSSSGTVDIQNAEPPEKIPKESEVLAGDSSAVLVQRESDGEIAFNGFCPVTLVQRKGLLLPGDVVLGSVKWERRYYAFVDKEKRELFLKDPAFWHKEAIEVARTRPELVPLLGLQSEFPDLQAPVIPVKAAAPKQRDSKFRDAGSETVLHPIESYIDRTYHWNQWELMKRKKILKGLENKRSKVCQTDISHYRRNETFQTIEWTDKNEQTLVDTGSQMPRNIRYIAGLRGDTQTQAKIVNLTLNFE